MNPDKVEEFKRRLAALINEMSLENESNTPDFILAQYLTEAMITFNRATVRRTEWYNP